MNQNLLRSIPKVDDVLRLPALSGACEGVSTHVLTEAVRDELNALRESIRSGSMSSLPSEAELTEMIIRRVRIMERPSLRPVVNGTGVVLHTNLGRACLGKKAAEAAMTAAGRYSTLEYDIEAGARGHRFKHVESLLCTLTGAEAAFVVNNNAAAVLLLLSALTAGGEVVISRGELVEIGGSFRVPDIMESCGAVLKEVGTTNKTSLGDFARAVNEKTRALLKVHTSNYRIVGFTESVPRADLVRLGHEKGLPVFEDIGSGSLTDLGRYGIHDEPGVKESVAAGMDVITFSGDKMLGGPQAGILVGKKEYIEILRRHPLARAMRVDKMTLAALESTLRSYADGTAEEDVPVLKMLGYPLYLLREKADRIAGALKALPADTETVQTEGHVGGGSVPMKLLTDYAIAVSPKNITVEELEKRLRLGANPVVGRLEEGRFLIHMRTLLDGDEETVKEALSEALK